MIELTLKDNRSFSPLTYNQHRLILSDLMAEGIVLNYAESNQRERFWIIMEAVSEAEAIDVLSDSPILSVLRLQITPLYTSMSNLSYGAVYSLN